MSNRMFFCFVGSSALIIGTSFYILCRQNSIVTVILQSFMPLNISVLANNTFVKSISYYFPDFLWALGLCCGLFAIFDYHDKSAIICPIITFTYGLIWEILQHADKVSGTFDYLDILMYLTASLLAVIFYRKRRNKQ